jgi:hypothetical protein
MSRTRKTRPIMVRAADKEDKGVGLEERHNHSQGECTLPESPEAQINTPRTYTGCYYIWLYTGHQLCGCPMCTDRWGRESKRVQRRRESKSAVRNWNEE